MNPQNIINKYYKKGTKSYNFLTKHSRMILEKSLEIAKKLKHLNPNLKFIEEASILHDTGIFQVNAPEIGCFGKKPYICHGCLGREILEKEGLSKHALVCEHHVGAGISKKEVGKENLPLPKRDMLPVSLEEKIICFADKFYSKIENGIPKEKTVPEIQKELSKFGEDPLRRFNNFLKISGD